MEDAEKTREQLIEELKSLRRRLAKGEGSESGRAEEQMRQREEEYRELVEHADSSILSDRKRVEEALKDGEQQMEDIIQGFPIPAFVIGKDHRVIHWNRALEEVSGIRASAVVGTLQHWRAFYREERPCLADLLVDEDWETIAHWYPERVNKSKGGDAVFEATQFFPGLGEEGKWLRFTAAPIRNARGRVAGAIETLEDVTDRKQAEEDLKESENRYRAIFENTGTVTLIVEEDTTISFANAEFEKLTGYPREEVENKRSWTEFVAKEDLARMMNQHRLRRADADAARNQYEFRLVDRQGGTKDVLLTVGMIADTQRSVASLLDITERKRAEEALRESQQQLANIIDFLPDATLVIDREGKVIAWNRAMEEMTGVKAAAVMGKGNYEYALPFYGERRPILIDLVLKPHEETAARYVSIERKEDVLAGEAYMPALGGGQTYLFGTASVLRNSKGQVVGAIESIRDITERRRVEESLTRAEEKYRGIFENALEGIYQVTVDGRILNCNPALAQILGYDSPDELTSTVTDLAQQLYVHPERRAELLRLIEERGEAKGFEAQFYRKDGTVAWVAVNARAVRDENGRIVCLEGILQDTTERKAMEARLFQSQKMEAVGTLAGGIAHDFNNMLAAIIGYTEIAKGKLEQAELRPYLDQVLAAGDRAKNLVTQILAFSRKAEKEVKPVDISPLLADALKLLRATLPSTIEIRPEITPRVGEVLADPIQLHQVIMNLCTNAAHAMRDKGGVIGIDLGRTEIKPEMMPLYPDLKPGPYVMLRVSDTGTGIAPEIIGKIFDPFFTTKKRGEGTGLGLSVVYGIIKECGGTVAVQSDAGRGSTFSIYLPAIEHGGELAEEPVGTIPRGRERLIFIDDEETLVRMGREMLEELGYEVVVTTSSAEALEIFRAHPDRYDLVLTDMTMPGLTGKELAVELLAIRPELPIILCTGYSEIISEEEAKSMGIREFAMKPLNLRTIAELIRKALGDRNRSHER